MKRTLIFIISLSLFCLALFGETDPEVYISKAGRKYHRESCSMFHGTKTAMKLSEAVRKKFEPCEKCNPPVLKEEESFADASSRPSLLRVNDPSVASYRRIDMRLLIAAEVIKVEDGDTVTVKIDNPPRELKKEEKVRLLGVDTPEMNVKEGKIAARFTTERLLHRIVFIACDWDLRDRYSRLLAYLYFANGESFNALLIQEGMSPAYVTYQFQFLKEFVGLEIEAKLFRKGFWALE